MAIECCICMEVVDSTDAVITNCDHIYHKICIFQWLDKSSKSSTCPACRLPLMKQSLRKVSLAEFSKLESTEILQEIENATSAKNSAARWNLILEICDKVSQTNPQRAQLYIRSMLKRMEHKNARIASQSVTLLDACIKNCGLEFRLKIASAEFVANFQRILNKAPPMIAQKMCTALKCWAENEFKIGLSLRSIPLLYAKLKSDGYDFTTTKQVNQLKELIDDDEYERMVGAIQSSSGSDVGATASSPYSSAEGIDNTYDDSKSDNGSNDSEGLLSSLLAHIVLTETLRKQSKSRTKKSQRLMAVVGSSNKAFVCVGCLYNVFGCTPPEECTSVSFCRCCLSQQDAASLDYSTKYGKSGDGCFICQPSGSVHKSEMSQNNYQRAPATANGNRSIYVGSVDKKLTKERLANLIYHGFNVAQTKFAIQILVSKEASDRTRSHYISFKISVDSDNTFNVLLNSVWPKYLRVREFYDRARM